VSLKPYSNELAELLLKLEDELNRDRFFGVSMGSTLATPFILEFWNGRGRWSRKTRWQLRMRRFYRYFQPTGVVENATLSSRNDLPLNPILITWLRDDPRYNGLVQPVLKHLPVGETIVLAREKSVHPLTGAHPSLPLAAPPPPDLQAWRAEYLRVSPRWARTLRTFVRKHGLPRESLPYLQTLLLHQSQRVAGYLEMLDRLKPRAILTEFDRNRFASCLILAAVQRGIPTATLVHGTINPPYGYTPVLADRIFAWGEIQRRQLLSMGTNLDKIRLVGFSRIERPDQQDAAALKQSVGLPADKPVIMLATNPIEPKARNRMITTFCDGFAGRDDLSVIVRTHPAEGLNAWEPYRDRYPAVRVFERGEQSVEDALAMTDVFVCNNTGMSMDALMHRVPVVLMDVPGSSLLSNQDLVDEGVACVVTTPRSLIEAVDTLLGPGSALDQITEKREAHIEAMFHAMGEEAAECIASELLELVGKSVTEDNPGGDDA
jgi:hypothetical protein